MHRMLAISAVFALFSVTIGTSALADDLEAKLKSAVVQAQTQLGTLPPWQKKIFDEEVVPRYRKFIKGYRIGSSSEVTTEVDYTALRNFLRYQAKGTQILVRLNPEGSCDDCKAANATIQELVKARLERRGFSPVFVADEDLGDVKPTGGKALNDKILDLAQQRNAAAAMVVGWRAAPVDPTDRVHQDEKHFLVTSYLNIRGLSRSEGKTELQNPPTFDTAAAELITDAFTEVGAKMELAEATSTDPSKEEMTVSLTGFKTYAEYVALKDKLQEKLKAFATLEERRLSRGQVVFAVITEKESDTVKRALAGFEAPVEVK